jgi:hypothetical protein
MHFVDLRDMWSAIAGTTTLTPGDEAMAPETSSPSSDARRAVGGRKRPWQAGDGFANGPFQ